MKSGAEFWAIIRQQLAELRTATNADEVVHILSKERNPYEHDHMAGDGFFAGSGGDDTVYEALDEAGWRTVWYEADYYWCMQREGSVITYVEGDIYRGDQRATPAIEVT